MTRNAQKQILRIVGLATTIFVLSGALLAQEISPLSDYQYKRDYAQYEEIKKIGDAQKRADAIIAFLKEHPINRILAYAAADYMNVVRQQTDAAKALKMAETLWALVPTNESIDAAKLPAGVDEFKKEHIAPTQKLVLAFFTDAYIKEKNYPKAVESAEKLYALSPDKALLPVIAGLYFDLKNTDKYLSYGQKILAQFPIEQPQGFSTAIQMAQVYIEKQDINAAIGLYNKVMAVYGDKVPPNVQEAQWNATRAFAYGLMASTVYSQKDYTKAQQLFERVIKFDSKRDDAYYYIAMCQWQNNDPAAAIEPLAKTVVLNKQFAAKAQPHLENLYKAQNNNSLDGLDKVLAQAKADLGI